MRVSNYIQRHDVSLGQVNLTVTVNGDNQKKWGELFCKTDQKKGKAYT